MAKNAFGNVEIDQTKVVIHELAIGNESSDPPVVDDAGRLYAKDVGAVAELHWRDDAGNVRIVTGPSAASLVGAGHLALAPTLAYGTTEARIAGWTYAIGAWKIAATIWNDASLGSAGTAYLRVRRKSDAALLLEILTTQTTEIELAPAALTISAVTEVEFFLAGSGANVVSVASKVRHYI